MVRSWKRPLLVALIALLLVPVTAWADLFFIFGRHKQNIPRDPVERAAILGVYAAYRATAMFEIRDADVRRVQPMVPTEDFVEQHDPREVYCVCVEYEARYKIPWNDQDEGPWAPTIRNVLVIQTRGGQYLALRPSGICPELCR
jgi:hypothetical protein